MRRHPGQPDRACFAVDTKNSVPGTITVKVLGTT
jgi:hypothetical protein